MFFRKIYFLWMAFFAQSVCIGQMQYDESIVQNPLKMTEASFYPVLKKPIKSFIYIIDKDTISKSYYNKTGNEELKFDYEKNKPLYKAVNKYFGNLKTETAFFVHQTLESTTTFKYDKHKNLIEWQRVKKIYDKKMTVPQSFSDVHWIIEYDANKKVKKKLWVDAFNKRSLTYEYFYDASKNLIETNESQWKEKYEYQNNLLVRKYRIFKPENSVNSSSEYQYDTNGLLVASSDNYHFYEYSYNASQLDKVIQKNRRDSTYQAIKLTYNNKLLSKADIITTDIHLMHAFNFKTDYLYFSWKRREPNTLSMEFSYDKYKNITEIKYFIKGMYQYSKSFIYDYY